MSTMVSSPTTNIIFVAEQSTQNVRNVFRNEHHVPGKANKFTWDGRLKVVN